MPHLSPLSWIMFFLFLWIYFMSNFMFMWFHPSTPTFMKTNFKLYNILWNWS